MTASSIAKSSPSASAIESAGIECASRAPLMSGLGNRSCTMVLCCQATMVAPSAARARIRRSRRLSGVGRRRAAGSGSRSRLARGKLYNPRMDRRDFLELRSSGSPRSGFSADPLFRISLAEWSFHRALFSGALSHLDFITRARKDYGLDGVEYVNQFFMDKARDQAYLREMKSRAEGEGVRSLLIMCDSEGDLGIPWPPSEPARSRTTANGWKRRRLSAATRSGSMRGATPTFRSRSRRSSPRMDFEASASSPIRTESASSWRTTAACRRTGPGSPP